MNFSHSTCANIHLCILVFYSSFVFSKNEGREWIVVVVCEETEIIKKSRKINI